MQTVTLTVLVCLVVSATASVIDEPVAVDIDNIVEEGVGQLDLEVDSVKITEVDDILEDEYNSVDNRNVNVGGVGSGDSVLLRQNFFRNPIPNTIIQEDIRASGRPQTRITCVRVNEVGSSQGASARMIGGGINQNFVTVRLTSARGRGWFFSYEVWGRY